MMFIKFSSIWLAFLITRYRSIKKYTASANKIPRGIISGPPLVNKLQTDSVLAAAFAAAVLSTCNKISNIYFEIAGFKIYPQLTNLMPALFNVQVNETMNETLHNKMLINRIYSRFTVSIENAGMQILQYSHSSAKGLL